MNEQETLRAQIERLMVENCELRRETFDLCAQLATQRMLVQTLEDVVRAMDKRAALA